MHYSKWWSESIVFGIDVNQILHRLGITTLAVLTGCLSLDTSVHAEVVFAEELADLDQQVARAGPQEALALRRERIIWRERHLDPSSASARVALDHAEDVLLVHLRSGQNAFRQLWTWPLVLPERRQAIHSWVRA